jgi:hypothetical protein
MAMAPECIDPHSLERSSAGDGCCVHAICTALSAAMMMIDVCI